MDEVTVRHALAEDVPNILETLRAALGETPVLKRTTELWEWKHVHNPFGSSLVLVADTGHCIAGVRALMRWDLTTEDGDTIRCLRAVDTATHPDFLRRGIFKELTMTALEEAHAQGIDLIFNTPNDKSAPGYLKMGWRLVSEIGVLIRPRLGRPAPIDPDSLPRIDALAPGLHPAEALPLDGLAQREARGMRTRRDASYLRWRFTGHPTAQYGWVGNDEDGLLIARASSRSHRSELVVSDLLGQPSAGVVRSAARLSRARYMAGWFSPISPERRIAIRGGMFPLPGLKPLRLMALPLRGLDIDVFDLGSWDIATSDLELL